MRAGYAVPALTKEEKKRNRPYYGLSYILTIRDA